MKDLVLISCPARQDRDDTIRQLAEWMGVPARVASVDDRAAADRLLAQIDGSKSAVAISADTLWTLRELASRDALEDAIENRWAKLLVYCVGASPAGAQSLRWLTGGAVEGLAPAAKPRAFRFPDAGRELSGVFAGQSFALEQASPVRTFDLAGAGSAGVGQLLLADERPVFLRSERGACEVLVLSVGRLAPIDTPLTASHGIEGYYDQLIPLLIFLRRSFATMCWQGTRGTGRLIIDDPLLNGAYGCLSYTALRNSMRSAGYGATIAFIPWNHWRTSRAKAGMAFDGRPDLSICVHGCDHTNREFDDTDTGSLQRKADTALRRMERHQDRTGLAFDPVMVFPQGKFTSQAMAALRAGGYSAAVNTTCFPTDSQAGRLTIAELLRPAITRFYGFPLFQRRYPRRLVDFAFDIFLGRPVLMVQHHQDFCDGYRQLEDFVAGLHKLEPNLSWEPLAAQVARSCMVRSDCEDAMEVRFFSSQFQFENTRPAPTALAFSKEEPDASAVSGVLVDGVRVPFSLENGLLTFEHRAAQGQVIDVRVLDRPSPRTPASERPGVSHTLGVCVRRTLSEFRDNALARHPRLLAAATGVARKMKVTGDSRKEGPA